MEKGGQFSTGIFILTLIVLVSSNLTCTETYTEWISEGDRRLYEHGNYSDAIEVYDKAIDIEPDNPQLKENKRIAVNRNETGEIKIRKPASKTTGIIGLIFLFCGAWVSIIGVKELKKAISSRNWLETHGKVISSEVVGGRGNYRPNISYEYSIFGTKYLSNVVFIGSGWGSSQKSAQRISNRYPVGKEVKVYHNSANPREAALEIKISFDICFTLLFGLIFSGMGLFTILDYLEILIF